MRETLHTYTAPADSNGASIETVISRISPDPVPVNLPPIVNAGQDMTITAPVSSVVLNATASDPEGRLASTGWEKVSGGAATIQSISSTSTLVSGLQPGAYEFRIRVKDDKGLETTDTVKVTVLPEPIVPPSGKYIGLQKSGPVRISGDQKGRIIEATEFRGSTAQNGNVIILDNVSNLTIRGCRITGGSGGDGGGGRGIYMMNCHHVTIEKCLLDNVKGGILTTGCTGGYIKINGNQFVNMLGLVTNTSGQFVQHSHALNSPGNEIIGNRGEMFFGETDPEDRINLFAFGGTAAAPLIIRGNIFRGGAGKSSSSTAIVPGDKGGANIIIENNILVNPGQAGIGVAGGQNISVLNNIIYSDYFQNNNIGLFVWNQQTTECKNITIKGNRVNYINKSDGSTNNWWNAGNCGVCNCDAPTTITKAEVDKLVPVHLIDFVTPEQLLQIRKKTL